MAFFGLTQVGYQDTVRETLKEAPTTPQSIYRSGDYRMMAYDILPPIENESRPTSGFGAGAQGSHEEYTRLKHKHIRDPKGNLRSGLPDVTDVFRRPVTTAQEVARWRSDEPLKEREPWTYTKRHVVVNSEMTKFVNSMCLTNREFSLF